MAMVVVAILACVVLQHARVDAFAASRLRSPAACRECRSSPACPTPGVARGARPRTPRPRPSALGLAATPVHPAFEPRTTHEVTLSLPLGLVLEDMHASDPSYGVAVIGIHGGHAADFNRAVFANIKSEEKRGDGSDRCICIRDKVVAVDGTPCDDLGFDDVIGLIAGAASREVTLELGRLRGATVVQYDDGVCISAKPGESYGFLAGKCGVAIEYECRAGQCRTCRCRLEFPDRDDERDAAVRTGGGSVHERVVLPCVGTVPRGYAWLHLRVPHN